jgi:hypothetical protein
MMQGHEMKLQTAYHGSERAQSSRAGSLLTKEGALLSSGVTLAFAFVTACIFLLG